MFIDYYESDIESFRPSAVGRQIPRDDIKGRLAVSAFLVTHMYDPAIGVGAFKHRQLERSCHSWTLRYERRRGRLSSLYRDAK
jgi:hypothetical protein